MRTQNLKLKYKVAPYKAITIIDIMILLFSHRTSVKSVPRNENKSGVPDRVYQEIYTCDDLANHNLMN